MIKRFIFRSIILLIVLACIPEADSSLVKAVGTKAVPFLKVGVASRPMGMGEAFTAVADDMTALHYNPAGLSQIETFEISLTHQEWLMDCNSERVATAVPVGRGVLGGSVLYCYTPQFDRYDDWGVPFEKLTVFNISAACGYGLDVIKGVRAGISFKYTYDYVAKLQESSAGLDAGLMYHVRLPDFQLLGYTVRDHVLRTAFAARNITLVREKGDVLPLEFALGLASEITRGFTMSVDLRQPMDGRFRAGIGFEYTWRDLVALRAGYKLGYTLDAVSFGMGLIYPFFGKRFEVDYSFAPYGVLQNNHNVTFSMKLFKRRKIITDVNVDEIYYKGIYHFTNDEIDLAIELWEKVIRVDPDHELARDKLAQARKLKQLMENVQIKPDELFEEAKGYLSRDSYEVAAKVLKKVLELAPDHEEAKQMLEECEAKMEKK